MSIVTLMSRYHGGDLQDEDIPPAIDITPITGEGDEAPVAADVGAGAIVVVVVDPNQAKNKS